MMFRVIPIFLWTVFVTLLCSCGTPPSCLIPATETAILPIEQEDELTWASADKCPCIYNPTIISWEDLNENGIQNADETVLKDVTAVVITKKHEIKRVTNEKGFVEIDLTGCDCGDFTVYTDTPTGYRLTTSERIASSECPMDNYEITCSFGFVRVDP